MGDETDMKRVWKGWIGRHDLKEKKWDEFGESPAIVIRRTKGSESDWWSESDWPPVRVTVTVEVEE